MMKADARRKQLRVASDKLEQAWANLLAQTGVLPFGSDPALCTPGASQYVLDWFDHPEPGEYWSSMDVSQSLDRIVITDNKGAVNPETEGRGSNRCQDGMSILR